MGNELMEIKKVMGSNTMPSDPIDSNKNQRAEKIGFFDAVVSGQGAADPRFNMPTGAEIIGFNGAGNATDAEKYGSHAYPSHTAPANVNWGGNPKIANSQSTAGTVSATAKAPVIAGGKASGLPNTLAGTSGFVSADGGGAVMMNGSMKPGELATARKMMDSGMSANGVRQMESYGRQAAAIAGQPTAMYQSGERMDDNGNMVPYREQIGTMSNAADGARSYDEQVAHAAEINKQTMAPSISRRDAWEMTPLGSDAIDKSSTGYQNAKMAEKRIMTNYTQAVKEQNDNNAFANAQKIAGIGADANRYTADQHLAGVKYNADQHLKGNEVTALAGMEKAKIAGKEKQAEKQHEAYLKDENEMKALLRDKYGVDPNVGLSAYKQYLQGLQAWDKQITKQLDLLKSGKSGYTPEQGAMIENALRVYHRNPQDEKAVATLEEARKLVTGGGKAQEPAWWGTAVSMPKFDHQKLPQLPSSKTYIAGA